jgi:3-dehydroquinate synthase
MRRVQVPLGARTYEVRIGSGLLADPASYADLASREKKIICDENVAAQYLDALLAATGLNAKDALILPAGEMQKTWQTAGAALDWMMSVRMPRDGVLLALGGGVIGDLAGFCAAVYQRGISFFQIPTTLLAQVDSSVGGKTAVNHARGKNMIGAYHQPHAVVADTGTLRTLPPRELRAGLAEVIKYAMLGDAAFFGWMEQHVERVLTLDDEVVAEVVARCCAMKAGIVAIDERESQAGSGGPRTLLNLGHTFGHAIETETGYSSWLHGEAVAVGLCMAADLSARLGWMPQQDADRCLALVAQCGLPTVPPASMTQERFGELMGRDKKVASGRLRLVLMRKLGEAVATADFDEDQLRETVNSFCERARQAQRGPHAA